MLESYLKFDLFDQITIKKIQAYNIIKTSNNYKYIFDQIYLQL